MDGQTFSILEIEGFNGNRFTQVRLILLTGDYHPVTGRVWAAVVMAGECPSVRRTIR